MKINRKFELIAMSMFMVAGLAACNKPAESTAGKIDQTATDAGNKIGDASDKAGSKLGDLGDHAEAVMSDSEITTKVKASIFSESGLKAMQIGVDTVKGVVTLTGSVDSQQNSDKAKSLASAVTGVTQVNNQLVLKPPHA
ncbi:MAG: BON domain-containing protein [Ferrovum sp.]|nr:BON domain-containing protein [Ferrovum sp.]